MTRVYLRDQRVRCCALAALFLGLVACSSTEDSSGSGGSGGGAGGGAAASGGAPPTPAGPTPTFAVTYHVRPPGSVYGSGDGTTWEDAYSGIPDTLERGARYLVATGDYRTADHATLELDDAPDGEQYIGIEKATVDDHGSASGWDAAFADGPARFDTLALITSHHVVDGKTGAGTEGHGFSFQATDCDAANAYTIAFPWDSESTHVVLRHLDLGHCGDLGYEGPSHDSIYSTRPLTDIWIQSCHVHDANRVHLMMVGWSNVVVDGCYFARNGDQQESHTIAATEVDGLTLRGNVFEDSPSAFVVLRGTSRAAIYSNIFLLTYEEGRGIYAAVDGSEDDGVLVYGNTFYKLFGLNAGIRLDDGSTGVEVFNNLWAGCRTNQIMLSGSHDYNAFFDNWRVEGGEYNLDERIEEEHVQVFAEDPFVDAAGWDLRLVAGPTESGQSFPAPYDEDLLGNRRGADGTWDRGAFEYSGAED